VIPVWSWKFGLKSWKSPGNPLFRVHPSFDVVFTVCCSEAAAHAVATLAEATLQGGGQIVLAETAAAVGALAGVQDATGTCPPMVLSTSRIQHTPSTVSLVVV